ncbi:hypothetical protein OG21DRAFT_1486746 [Imleria badia]|nr:hypothetical protein OG21DRAFT_1486746 [Imleria badia]
MLSIAHPRCEYVPKIPLPGVVYNPFIEYLGGRPRIVPHTRHRSTSKAPPRIPETPPFLSKAQIAVEWGSDRGTPVIHDKAGSSLRLAGGKMLQSLGLMSSAEPNFSMVVQGALDLYWEIGYCDRTEAGSVVTGSHAVFKTESTDVNPIKVTLKIPTRKYLVVGGIPELPDETGRQAQLRGFTRLSTIRSQSRDRRRYHEGGNRPAGLTSADTSGTEQHMERIPRKLRSGVWFGDEKLDM